MIAGGQNHDNTIEMLRRKWRMPERFAASPDVRNPELLAIRLDRLQSSAVEFAFRKSQKSKVGQIAENCLKPSFSRQNFTNARIKKFIGIESEHGDVLRSPGSGNRIKH